MIKWFLLIIGIINGLYAIVLGVIGNGSSGIVCAIFHIYVAAFLVTWQIEKKQNE